MVEEYDDFYAARTTLCPPLSLPFTVDGEFEEPATSWKSLEPIDLQPDCRQPGFLQALPASSHSHSTPKLNRYQWRLRSKAFLFRRGSSVSLSKLPRNLRLASKS